MKKIYLYFICLFFVISSMAQTNDVGVIRIIKPIKYICNGSINNVIITIKNFGTQTQTQIPLFHRLGTNPPVEEVWSGSLQSGDTIDYYFYVPVCLPYNLPLDFCAYTHLISDTTLYNDSICESLLLSQLYSPNAINWNSTVNNGTIVTYKVNKILNATSYIWSYIPALGINISSSDTTAVISFGNGASSGKLSVYAIDTNTQCNSMKTELNITVGTGINEINDNSFILSQNFPNPAAYKTNIEYMLTTAAYVRFELSNLLGERLWFKSIKAESGKNNISLDVSSLPKGIYYYSMEFKGKKQFKKLMVSN